MVIKYSTKGLEITNCIKQTFLKKFSAAHLCQDIPFLFWQSNISVLRSRQQIADRHFVPQDHSSHPHNKRDIREKITEGENSPGTVVNVVIINLI